MARLRYNGLVTSLGASLSSSATTVTFAAPLTHSGGVAVPTIVSGDYLPMSILDSSGNLSELVNLTAYTSGSTTGTIARAQEGTAATAQASGNKVLHGLSVVDLSTLITSPPAGYSDIPPASASAYDDEFGGSSAATWTTTPTAPAQMDTTTRQGWLYIKTAANSAAWVGKYQSAPTTYPYTIITKVESDIAQNNSRSGLVLGPASPTNSTVATQIGFVKNAPGMQRTTQTFGGTWQANNGGITTMVPTFGQTYWLKVTVTNATTFSWWASLGGGAYYFASTGWTLGESNATVAFNIGVIGVYASAESTSIPVQASFDYFRVS